MRANRGFLAEHYELVVLAVGVLALAGGVVYYFTSNGGDVDEAVDGTVMEVAGLQPKATGVKPVDMAAFKATDKLMRTPPTLAEVPEASASFLASERRFRCVNKDCRLATTGTRDLQGNLVCTFCGFTQEVKKVEVVLDTDGDGLPDTWEKKNGLNPNDPQDAAADKDGDDFTNEEEYGAKTDPTDRRDHPDYLDSLKLQLPLKQTYMPVLLMAANQIPGGWRCEFLDPKQKDDYGRMGRKFTATIGEEIGKTGYVLKSFTRKTAKESIKGSVNHKEVDVSEAVVERTRDGKRVTLVMARSKKDKFAAVDVQATLVYERRSVKSFDVVSGMEIVLSGTKYKIGEIKATGKGAIVVVENAVTGKKRTIPAQE